MNYIILWAIVLTALLVVEGATAQLVTIWFAAGALVSLISAALHAPVWFQVTLFIVVSAVTLAATRPFVKKIKGQEKVSLNADRCIGETAVVLETIDNVEATGSVKVGGIVWTARSSDNSVIEKGKKVTVEKIDGVKVIVKEN